MRHRGAPATTVSHGPIYAAALSPEQYKTPCNDATDSKKSNKRGRRKQYPRLARRRPSSEVRNLVKYSPVFGEQSWQRYHIKDTEKGPDVWEIKWSAFWRKGEDGLPGRRNCLIVARNVLTGEMKYFVANRVPGEKVVTLRWLLRVAFGRWPIESCFREAKHELGMDHYQVRGRRCIHRHFFLTQVSHLFCARVRQEYDEGGTQGDRLTVEHVPVRNATNTWLAAADLPPAKRKERYEKELNKQRYHQRRNRQSRTSHTKTRLAQLEALGITVQQLKSYLSILMWNSAQLNESRAILSQHCGLWANGAKRNWG